MWNYQKLNWTKMEALKVERKLWIYTVIICFKILLNQSDIAMFHNNMIYDEVNIFWSCNGSISILHGSFSSLFSWGQLGTYLPRRLMFHPLTPTHPSTCHSQMAYFPHKCDYVNQQWIKPRDFSLETFVLNWLVQEHIVKYKIYWLKLALSLVEAFSNQRQHFYPQ